MANQILFVGVDVDDNAFHACAVLETDTDFGEFSCKPNAAALAKKLKKYQEAGYRIRICYEATYLGFSLCRSLIGKGFECEVIAPSLVPRLPGSQVKTDRIDCRKLARFYQQGLLTAVHLPDEEEESVRDLMRTRKFISEQVRATKLHILALCRRAGLDFRNVGSGDEKGSSSRSYWSTLHRKWLTHQAEIAEQAFLRKNLKLLLDQLGMLELQLTSYDQELEKIATSEKYTRKVQALCCYRGIKVLTALSFIVEIGDVRRFSHPKKLASYAGMDLREYSSGGHQRRFSMTKQGNPYLRTTAILSAQFASQSPRLSRRLVLQRKEADPKHIEIAERCMSRLHRKATRLLARGKPSNKVKTACARELLCFVWESLRAIDTGTIQHT